MLEEADQDLCLPLPLTHVALFNSSRSSIAGPARIESATPYFRERQSNRPNHAGELRQPAIGVSLTAKVTAKGERPREGGRPRAAHAYHVMPVCNERTDQHLHPLQQTCRFLLLCPFCRRFEPLNAAVVGERSSTLQRRLPCPLHALPR